MMGKSLKDFLNQPESLRQPTAEDHALAALLNGEVVNILAPKLPDGAFTREQVEVVVAQFANVVIEEGENAQFRLVVLHESGKFWRWREWNFAAGAGMRMNRSIERFGVRKPQ